MAVRVGDLNDQQIERLRAELVELLARRFAYPPFFDHSASESRVRPADRAKRQEITDYVRRVDLAALASVEVSAPEVRRFFEALVLGYIERNPALARRFMARRVPEMRASAAKAVSAIQRGLVAFTQGTAPTYGGPQPAPSWAGPARTAPYATDEDLERSTAVLAAVLTRTHADGAANLPSVEPISAGSTPSTPLRPQVQPIASRRDTREPTPETYRMYGDYLDDLNTEHAPTVAAIPAASSSTSGAASAAQSGQWGPLDARDGRAHGAAASSASYPAPFAYPVAGGMPATPAMPASASGSLRGSGESRTDEMIFRQLRYQLEAYVRRTARSHGLATMAGGDLARMLDLLRRASRIDEADVRLIEGILALTDRVTAQGQPTLADYRQAMMLYLLYHRGHLGE